MVYRGKLKKKKIKKKLLWFKNFIGFVNYFGLPYLQSLISNHINNFFFFLNLWLWV